MVEIVGGEFSGDFRCPECKTRRSVRHGSFFEKSKLSLRQLVQIMYYWSRDEQQQDKLRFGT